MVVGVGCGLSSSSSSSSATRFRLRRFAGGGAIANPGAPKHLSCTHCGSYCYGWRIGVSRGWGQRLPAGEDQLTVLRCWRSFEASSYAQEGHVGSTMMEWITFVWGLGDLDGSSRPIGVSTVAGLTTAHCNAQGSSAAGWTDLSNRPVLGRSCSAVACTSTCDLAPACFPRTLFPGVGQPRRVPPVASTIGILTSSPPRLPLQNSHYAPLQNCDCDLSF